MVNYENIHQFRYEIDFVYDTNHFVWKLKFRKIVLSCSFVGK